jgi:two-component system, chemotaxis family, sensor kinase CheA
LLKTTNDFLELLFKENYDQSMMDDLNPLSDANLTFNNKKIKYLDFNFRNIETGYGNDKEVMVTVKDITEQVKLEHKLEESQQDAQRQMDWLVNILHVDPPLLQEFIVSANEEIANVEKLLSEGLDNKNGADILKTVYRSMHLIKGNASLLALKAFSEQAHEFEEKINQIQRKKTIDKNDLQTLCAELAGIKKTLNEVNKLLERIGKIHEQMRPRRSYEHKVMIQSFQNLVSQLSEEQSKPIRLETKDFKIEEIPHNNRIFTKEIMVQLIRNSVAHGIEEASQRKENNKPEEAEIIIKTEADDHGFSFSVRDDGHGIQLKKLRQQAEKSGKWDLKELSEWDDQKMIALVYEHGISTNENTDLISGRGVGLDLVKEKVQSKNGTIDIDFETGKYCQFTIKIPINK